MTQCEPQALIECGMIIGMIAKRTAEEYELIAETANVRPEYAEHILAIAQLAKSLQKPKGD